MDLHKQGISTIELLLKDGNISKEHAVNLANRYLTGINNLPEGTIHIDLKKKINEYVQEFINKQ